MPTVGWIQESALDRYLEQCPSDNHVKDPEYPCRICGQVYDSIAARDQHEINHPVLNPAIFIDGKEICSDQILITSPMSSDGVLTRNVDFITINGEIFASEIDLLGKITEAPSALLDVRYGNFNVERRLKIIVKIADDEELKSVDEAFIHYFDIAGLNNDALLAFTQKVNNLESVQAYSDGMVRYIQALMAKDGRSNSVKFDMFFERFNQATFSLRSYQTPLANAIRSVVDFNRNDFSFLHKSGILLLDSAIDFFQGGELKSIEMRQDIKAFPVDFCTESILARLLPLYKEGSYTALIDDIKTFSPQYLSLQDKKKFDYICYRKCLQLGDEVLAQQYKKNLRFDDAFSEIIGSENE